MIETELQTSTLDCGGSWKQEKTSVPDECVVISTGRSKLHLYYAAAAAQQAGLLHTMITSIYLKKTWLPFINFLLKMTPKTVLKRLLLCRDERVRDSKVVSLPSISLVAKLRTTLAKRGISNTFRRRLERIESVYYGKRANTYIRAGVKLIHSRSGYSRAIIPYAKNRNIKLLLEQSAAHPKFANKLLEDEYEKWQVPQKFRTYVDPAGEMEWDIAHADYILTNSDFCAETIRPYVGNPENVRVIYTGADTCAFCPNDDDKPDDTFTLLFVGTVNINKGIIYLLRAFKKLKLPKANLTVVGKRMTDLPEEFESFKGLYNPISFVPHNELPALMSKSDVFILPSLTEGSARVVAEAMACGTACIVTHHCGSKISDGVDGFIVPIRDEDALAEKILQLYRDRKLCREMGRNAREKAVSSLTWKHYQKNLVTLYADIIKHEK